MQPVHLPTEWGLEIHVPFNSIPCQVRTPTVQWELLSGPCKSHTNSIVVRIKYRIYFAWEVLIWNNVVWVRMCVYISICPLPMSKDLPTDICFCEFTWVRCSSWGVVRTEVFSIIFSGRVLKFASFSQMVCPFLGSVVQSVIHLQLVDSVKISIPVVSSQCLLSEGLHLGRTDLFGHIVVCISNGKWTKK